MFQLASSGGEVRANSNDSKSMISFPILVTFYIWRSPEAEFLNVIGTKVLRVFLHAIHSHLY
jgi:hypothetical protein